MSSPGSSRTRLKDAICLFDDKVELEYKNISHNAFLNAAVISTRMSSKTQPSIMAISHFYAPRSIPQLDCFSYKRIKFRFIIPKDECKTTSKGLSHVPGVSVEKDCEGCFMGISMAQGKKIRDRYEEYEGHILLHVLLLLLK